MVEPLASGIHGGSAHTGCAAGSGPGMGVVYLLSTPRLSGRAEGAAPPVRSGHRVPGPVRARGGGGPPRPGPYTAGVLDSDTDGNQLWLASSHVPGPSPSGAVREHGPLPVTRVLTLAAGIAEASQSIHAVGIIHRDLKPSNVLLAADGPRVIDFGIARAADASGLTETGVRLGAPAFMAPEQADGRSVGPAVDVFALGLVLFHAATGQHAFGDGDGLGLLYRTVTRAPDMAACPEPLRRLVGSCLDKDPARRPDPYGIVQACRDIAESLGADLNRGDGWWLPEPGAAATRDAVTDGAPTPRRVGAEAHGPHPLRPAVPGLPARRRGGSPLVGSVQEASGPRRSGSARLRADQGTGDRGADDGGRVLGGRDRLAPAPGP
ncbi:serine/threonine-protein kinase [Streptomyces sp. M19]